MGSVCMAERCFVAQQGTRLLLLHPEGAFLIMLASCCFVLTWVSLRRCI
jgi:hypothetical protein